jgi:hypothetical protein
MRKLVGPAMACRIPPNLNAKHTFHEKQNYEEKEKNCEKMGCLS